MLFENFRNVQYKQYPLMKAIDIAEFANLINEARQKIKQATDLINGRAKVKLLDDMTAEERRLYAFLFRIEDDFLMAADFEYQKPETPTPLFGQENSGDLKAVTWAREMEAKRKTTD